MFQHTAARRRLGIGREESRRASACFNTQPPEGGWLFTDLPPEERAVSTHSRPKAAGLAAESAVIGTLGFNTQPPEGGWITTQQKPLVLQRFNTQPPEGGWHYG